MQLQKIKQRLSTTIGIEYNKLTIDTLFNKYAKIGFIYPAKKEILKPFFLLIKSNWLNLYKSVNPDLIWIFSKRESDFFASITAIRHGNHSMFAQHLVSNGNPVLSLEVMLAAQQKALATPNLKSCQNWFRPENRYPFRVFASFVKKNGCKIAGLNRFSFFHQSLIGAFRDLTLKISNVESVDTGVINFVEQYLGRPFVVAEELDSPDISFKNIGLKYNELGLIKSRKVVKVTDSNNTILGVAIANRAPIGLNFSFLENRAYYIIDSKLNSTKREEVILNLNLVLSNYYKDFALQKIPIVTAQGNKAAFENTGATYIRDYMQSIWLKEAFTNWYDHINAFLTRIKRN